MILAPATMAAEKDPKEAARKCLEEIGLDPDSYRVGHTKARVLIPCSLLLYFVFRPFLFPFCSKIVNVSFFCMYFV